MAQPEQGSAQDVFAKLAGLIAEVLGNDTGAGALTVEALKSSELAQSFKVTCGAATGFAKIFGATKAAQEAFEREKYALGLLQGEGIPKLRLVSEADRFICTEFIDGDPIQQVISDANLMQHSEFLGQWFGRLANHAPSESYDRNWYEYLKNYTDTFDEKLLRQQRPILETCRIFRVTLAHNDNAPSNFILGKDKHLYGVDFEDCMMKPEGWDLVTAARHLAHGHLADLPMISSSLHRGYRMTAEEALLPDNFDQVVNVLVTANIVSKRAE